MTEIGSDLMQMSVADRLRVLAIISIERRFPRLRTQERIVRLRPLSARPELAVSGPAGFGLGRQRTDIPLS